jgi:uncharacterized protein (DUF58 family)
LSKIQKILIKTKRQIFSEVPANNPSIFEGEGFDFVELREYEYGDDVRKIDWNVTAKMQKPYIRIFREERELNIVIVALLSGSLHFGSKRFKQELLAEIVALLGFSAVKNSDRFSLFTYDKSLIPIVRPTKRITAVSRGVEQIYQIKAIGKRVDSKGLSRELLTKIKRRSIIFLVGDFFEEYDLRLLSKKHEVIAIILRDKLEEHPPLLGSINLFDPSSLSSQYLDLNSSTKKEYEKQLQKRDHTLYMELRRSRVAFTKIYTDENPYIKLKKLFIKR